MGSGTVDVSRNGPPRDLGHLLFGFLLGMTNAAGENRFTDDDRRGKRFLVIGTGAVEDIGRHAERMVGGDLLQGGLPVEAGAEFGGRGHDRVENTVDDLGGSFDTELDIHRTEYGFDRVREDGRLFASSGGFLAATEQKMLAKAEGPGDHSKCLGTHDGGTKLSELPFGQIGMVREKGVSDNEPQYRVAEKFEPLVIGDLTVLVSVRPVGQRMPEQTGIEVGDPEDLPKRIHRENRPGS